MKNLLLSIIIVTSLILVSCTKEPATQRYKYLTEVTWVSDTLFAIGLIAADTKGIVKGRVFDKVSGDPLIGANEMHPLFTMH